MDSKVNLHDVIASFAKMARANEERKQRVDEAREKLASAGYTQIEIARMEQIIRGIMDMVGAFATLHVVVELENHVPSATLGVALAKYMIDAISWVESVIDNAGIDRNVYGLQDDFVGYFEIMKEGLNFMETSFKNAGVSTAASA